MREGTATLQREIKKLPFYVHLGASWGVEKERERGERKSERREREERERGERERENGRERERECKMWYGICQRFGGGGGRCSVYFREKRVGGVLRDKTYMKMDIKYK